VFETPSGAAVQVRGKETNGWDFWAAPSGDGTLIALSELRRKLREEGPREPKPLVARAATSAGEHAPNEPASATSMADLVEAGLLPADARLLAKVHGQEHVARVRDGNIELNGQVYPSLSAAAVAITGKPTNGWTFWRIAAGEKFVPLAKLRDELRERVSRRG
jgi:Restriction Enzyme Adenine Methylase Associated/Protein of unknown function (DUF2924)